jgi:hypothetical protein
MGFFMWVKKNRPDYQLMADYKFGFKLQHQEMVRQILYDREKYLSTDNRNMIRLEADEVPIIERILFEGVDVEIRPFHSELLQVQISSSDVEGTAFTLNVDLQITFTRQPWWSDADAILPFDENDHFLASEWLSIYCWKLGDFNNDEESYYSELMHGIEQSMKGLITRAMGIKK